MFWAHKLSGVYFFIFKQFKLFFFLSLRKLDETKRKSLAEWDAHYRTGKRIGSKNILL